MSRAYRGVHPKVNCVYSVNCLMELYSVMRNTVTNWVKQGLKPSDDRHPYVFNGTEVKRFHEERRQRTKTQLRIGEFKCRHCKAATFPEGSTVEVRLCTSAKCMLAALCFDCQKPVSKILKKTDCDKVQKCRNTGTTLDTADEEVAQIPSGIGKDRGVPVQFTYSINDRILFEWMRYAGRLDTKTVDAHLRSIRTFERFHQGKPFERVKKEDISRFRNNQKDRANAENMRLSVSTIRHRASHLKAFFEWLLKQPGYKRLDQTLPDYFALPKKFAAQALPTEEKPAPTIDQVNKMLAAMPTTSILQRRDRAMVALPFLGALRADTTTSLRIKHLIVRDQQIIQNSAESRTKNGKNLIIYWFPVSLCIREACTNWLEEIRALGFREEDPLFPSKFDLMKPPAMDVPRVKPMDSTSSIQKSFKTAGAMIGEAFSPHSAKHTIGQLMYHLCKTAKERKAWSLNMAHDREVVTETYYNKIPLAERRDIFQNFDNASDFSIQNMELMLMYHAHELTKGTPEHTEAETLVKSWQRRDQSTNDVIMED